MLGCSVNFACCRKSKQEFSGNLPGVVQSTPAGNDPTDALSAQIGEQNLPNDFGHHNVSAAAAAPCDSCSIVERDIPHRMQQEFYESQSARCHDTDQISTKVGLPESQSRHTDA